MGTGPRDSARTTAIANVQALRAVAAIIVVVHHMALPQFGIDNLYGSTTRLFSWFISFGEFGVDLFFVISGFIMVVTTSKLMGSANAAPLFLLRRIVRIYPPYWLALLPVFVAHWYFIHHGLHILGGAPNAKTNLIATFFLLPHPVDEFLVLPPAWTLVFEMSFYVVFAFLLLLKRRYLLSSLAVWFIVEIIMFFTFADSSNFLLAFLGTPLPIEFIAGAVIGLLFIRNTMPCGRLAVVIGLGAIAAFWLAEIRAGDVLYAHFGTSPREGLVPASYHNNIGRVILAGIPSFLIVYGAVACEARGYFTAPAWLVHIGNSSYALYLWNLTIIVGARQLVLRLHPHGILAHVVVAAFTLGCVVVFSIVVYRFFERPVTDRLHRFITALNTVPEPLRAVSG